MDVVERSTCNDIDTFGIFGEITKRMFCAGNVKSGGVDTCQVKMPDIPSSLIEQEQIMLIDLRRLF